MCEQASDAEIEIEIELDPDLADHLERRAAGLHCTVEALVVDYLEEYLQTHAAPDAPPQTPVP